MKEMAEHNVETLCGSGNFSLQQVWDRLSRGGGVASAADNHVRRRIDDITFILPDVLKKTTTHLRMDLSNKKMPALADELTAMNKDAIQLLTKLDGLLEGGHHPVYLWDVTDGHCSVTEAKAVLNHEYPNGEPFRIDLERFNADLKALRAQCEERVLAIRNKKKARDIWWKKKAEMPYDTNYYLAKPGMPNKLFTLYSNNWSKAARETLEWIVDIPSWCDEEMKGKIESIFDRIRHFCMDGGDGTNEMRNEDETMKKIMEYKDLLTNVISSIGGFFKHRKHDWKPYLLVEGKTMAGEVFSFPDETDKTNEEGLPQDTGLFPDDPQGFDVPNEKEASSGEHVIPVRDDGFLSKGVGQMPEIHDSKDVTEQLRELMEKFPTSIPPDLKLGMHPVGESHKASPEMANSNFDEGGYEPFEAMDPMDPMDMEDDNAHVDKNKEKIDYQAFLAEIQSFFGWCEMFKIQIADTLRRASNGLFCDMTPSQIEFWWDGPNSKAEDIEVLISLKTCTATDKKLKTIKTALRANNMMIEIDEENQLVVSYRLTDK